MGSVDFNNLNSILLAIMIANLGYSYRLPNHFVSRIFEKKNLQMMEKYHCESANKFA